MGSQQRQSGESLIVLRTSSAKLLSILSLISGSAYAEDFGIHEDVFDIAEKDARLLLIESAYRADWNQATQKIADSARLLEEDFPNRGFPTPEMEVSSQVELSVVTTRDIIAPFFDNGEIIWKVVVPANKVISTEEITSPNIRMFFFDSNSAWQSQLAVELIDEGIQVDLVSTSGVGHVLGGVDQPIFYATKQVIDLFKIKFAPSFVYMGDGGLRITSFPISSDVSRVLGVLQ